MQSITIGKPSAYLRLTTVRPSPDVPPKYLPRLERRYVNAELQVGDLSANCRLDLHDDYGGLVQFFDQVATGWPDWDNSAAVWGLNSALRLELRRGPRPALGPDHLQLGIRLHDGGRRTFWRA